MSDQGAGRGYANQNSKYKAGNKPGYNSKRNSFQNEKKQEEDKTGQTLSPENHRPSGMQPSGSDNRWNKPGNRNSFDNSQRNQGSNFSSKGNRPQVRAFSMSPNSNPAAEFNPKVSNSDDYKQRTKSLMSALKSARNTQGQVDPNANDFDKSSISPSAPILHSVKTESGPFQCSDNLPEPNKSHQSDSKNAEGANIKREASCVSEVEGDLFSAPENVSLAHCVGADLRMGSGVAVRFREQFKSIGKLFNQRVGPGGVASISCGQRHIFYLITKQASLDKPTLDTMRQALVALSNKCKELGVTHLAMPQIGCGLDGLSWQDVKEMLEEIFADGFAITIYKLDKDFIDASKPGSKSRVVNNNSMLKDINPGTGLLYIGYEDGFVSEEMKSINEKYPFLSRIRNPPHRPGSAVYTIANREDVVYGLICKKTADSRLNYEDLEAAITHLKYHNHRHNYEYFGLQAFLEKDDPYVMEKIDTLFRNSFITAEFWICWPPALEHKRVSHSEKTNEGTQVQESPYRSTGNRQSSSPHSSNSAQKSKGWKNNKDSPKDQSKGDNSRRNSRNKDQAVREVEEKMEAQTMKHIDDPKSETNCSEAENDALNTSERDWDDDDKQLAELPDPVDSSDTTDNDEWFGKDKYAEDERRKSNEKKEANKLSKIKEKQERKSVKPSCVTECKGDLFDAEDTISLAHCVGADLRMGSGIAVLFRQTFNSLPELIDQRVDQGGVAYLQHGKRYIFYLVTKKESTGKPTYTTLERSLIELRKKCKELNITELAMPRIGCGLDRLEWSRVKPMLEDIFADGFSIKIYNLEKDYTETKQSMPKTTIKNEILYLKDIERGTGLLYIGTVEPFVSEEMKSLDEKYPFLQRLSKDKPTLGTVVRTEAASYPREIVTGLICKQSANSPLSFVHLHAALKQLKKTAKTVKYYGYYGIQAFMDKDDDNVMGKIETLFRYSYIEAEVWICFPPSLKHLMSTSSSPMFSPNTSGNGRTLWDEAEHRRMVALIRDYQQTREAMYRRLTSLDDMREEIHGSDGLMERINRDTTRIDELYEKMDELSSKTDRINELYLSLYESHEMLTTKYQDLDTRIQLLEQQPQPPPCSVAQGYCFNLNGTYSGSAVLDRPLPIVPGSAAPVWPTPADYYTGNVPFVHSSYPQHPQFYASDQVPGEREALTRAARYSAKKNGHEIRFAGNGNIFMKKKNQPEFRPISSHGDLYSLENS